MPTGLSPAARRALLKQIRDERTRKEYEKLRAKLLAPAAKAARAVQGPTGKEAELRKAGVSPATIAKVKKAGLLDSPGLFDKAAKNILESAIYTPAGLYEIGKAVTSDVAAALDPNPRGADRSFKRSRKVGKAVAASTAETIKHPLRRPGDTLLLGLGLATGGASLASRASAAGSAAKAASAAGRSSMLKAALTRPGHKGGSLLRKPTPEPRYLRMGDAEVRARYSASPAVRGIQKAFDKATDGKGGFTEAGAVRRVSREIAQNRKVTDAAQRAPSLALANAGRKLTGAQQMALRVWAEGSPVDAKIARHKKAVATAKGQKRQDLAVRIGLLEASKQYLKETPGDDGTVLVELADTFKTPRKRQGTRGASPNALRAVADRIDRVAGDQPGGRERVLKEMGLLDDEQIAFRKNAPGRMDLGATFGTGAKETARRIEGLESELDYLNLRGEILATARPTEVPGPTVENRRPRTREEAEARAGKLDEALEPLISQLASGVATMGREARKGAKGAVENKYDYWIDRYGKEEGARIAGLPDEDRKLEGFVQGERKGYANRRQLDERAEAEEILSQIAGRDPARELDINTLLAVHEALAEQGVDMVKLRKALDERDELRGLLRGAEPTPDNVFAGAPARDPDYGTVAERVQEPGYTIPGRLSDEDAGALAALEELRAELDRGDIRGAESFQGGRVRIPDVPNVRQRQAFKPGQFRGGVPRKPGSVTHGYTGALRESGNYRVKTTQVVAESGLEAQRYASVSRLRSTMLKAARDARPADTARLSWVPVREKSSLSPKVRQKLRDVGERVETDMPLSIEEKRVAQAAWQEFVDDIFPTNEFKTVGVGEKVPGVKWIPKQALDGINKPLASGAWGASLAVLDTALNLVKSGIILAKPAYITANAGGTALFNLTQQGVFLPANWKRSVALLRHKDLGPAMRDLMGAGASQAILQGNPRGPLAGALNKTADVAAELMLEPMMRLSALVHEGRRFGIKTNEQWLDLVQNPARLDDLSEMVRRAKDAVVDYEQLGPIERAVARRALFIYPWVKGATRYGGHFLMEHPVQAATYSQLANVGREESDRELGEKPSWARGLFKVGGTDDRPLTVNPTGISTVSQAAQIGQVTLSALTGEGGSADQLGGLIHPAATAVLQGLFKRDLDTGAGLKGSFPDIVASSLLKDTAPNVYADQLERADGDGQDRRAYPMTRTQATLRFGLGSWAPRTTNREVLNERAREERERSLSPEVRAQRDVARERQSLFAKIKRNDPRVLENGRLPKGIRQAYTREAAVKAARAVAKRDYGSELGYQRAAMIAEAKLAEKWGVVDKGFGAQAATWVEGKTADEIKKARERLRYQALRPAYQDVTSRARKYLNDE